MLLVKRHIRFETRYAFFRDFDLAGEVFEKLIFHSVFLTLVVRLYELEPGNVNLQVHLFLDVGVARGKGFDLSIRKGGFVNVLAASNGAFARHNL